MKPINGLNNIFGGVLGMLVDFQPGSADIEFLITSAASIGDIEFATQVHSGLTGTSYQDSKNLFLKKLDTAITENTTTIISIHRDY